MVDVAGHYVAMFPCAPEGALWCVSAVHTQMTSKETHMAGTQEPGFVCSGKWIPWARGSSLQKEGQLPKALGRASPFFPPEILSSERRESNPLMSSNEVKTNQWNLRVFGRLPLERASGTPSYHRSSPNFVQPQKEPCVSPKSRAIICFIITP